MVLSTANNDRRSNCRYAVVTLPNNNLTHHCSTNVTVNQLRAVACPGYTVTVN